MDEYEQKLKCTPLVAPSKALDRRIEGAFAAARRRREAVAPKFWWWLAAVITVGGVTALVVISPRRPLATTDVVYRVEAPGQLREILLNPAISREPAPQFVVHEATIQ